MFTQQEKAAMFLAFDEMSPHDQVVIHQLIHSRAKAHASSMANVPDSGAAVLLGGEFSRVDD